MGHDAAPNQGVGFSLPRSMPEEPSLAFKSMVDKAAEKAADNAGSKPVEKTEKEHGPVDVLFKLPAGGEKAVTFTKRPLGLDFARTAPITIKEVKPRSHSELLGIEVEWIVKSVNGEELPGIDFSRDYAALKKAVEFLPMM